VFGGVRERLVHAFAIVGAHVVRQTAEQRPGCVSVLLGGQYRQVDEARATQQCRYLGRQPAAAGQHQTGKRHALQIDKAAGQYDVASLTGHDHERAGAEPIDDPFYAAAGDHEVMHAGACNRARVFDG
jgi:hypothetical protein